MNGLQNQEDNIAQQNIGQYTEAAQGQDDSTKNLMLPILRRWPIVLVTFIVVAAVSLPAVWFLFKPGMQTSGAIRVTPIVSRILFTDTESERAIPNYENFINTQVTLVASSTVLNRVADELADKNLLFFEGVVDYVTALKLAITNEVIKVEPAQRSELITITMITHRPRESELIINSIIRAYMAVVVSSEIRGGDKKLAVLEEKHRAMAEKIQIQYEIIRELAEEYGSAALTGRQDMLMQQVVSLQNELTSVEVKRLSLEARLKMKDALGEQLRPGELLRIRSEFINSDFTIQSVLADIVEYERVVTAGKQALSENNPHLKQNIKTLENLKQQLEQRRKEVADKFDKGFNAELERSRDRNLAEVKVELERTIEYENRIRQRLAMRNSETIAMGRKQLTIDEQQEKLARLKEMAGEVSRRIEELEVERKRPARISVAYYASSFPAKGKRLQMTIVATMGSLVIGGFLALVVDRLDKSLQGPDDVIKQIGAKIIGTTTGPNRVDKPLLEQQLMNDYQNIRANLGLINGGGRTKIIVIASAGTGDGKTTFAVNLSASFAQSGEKVLLIDGDLRKPDIAGALNLPANLRGFQDLLLGKDLDEAVYKMSYTELYVLAADQSNVSNAVDILKQEETAAHIRNAAQSFDHVIIDTPPILSFNDALLWARMADATILTSLVGRTSRADLREAMNRLEEIGARILGTIVNNVKVNQSYHRYGYGYVYNSDGSYDSKLKYDKHNRRKMLLIAEHSTNQRQGNGES